MAVRVRPLPPDDPRHGTPNGYDNWRCHCERCRKAHAVQTREKTHRLGWRVPHEAYQAQLKAKHVAETELRCFNCGGWKPDSEFAKASAPKYRHRRGRRSECRACGTIRRRQARAKMSEAQREAQRAKDRARKKKAAGR